MSIQDDETLQMYLEESMDHLSDIENDFLTIEEDGANINEDLVNKVYRAAHSIKGGAGFMGLTNIKDLTHEMENILGKIRSREMTPTPEMVNILLNASDALKALMDDILNSNDIDISDHINALKSVLEGGGTDAPEPSPPVASPATETTEPLLVSQDPVADGNLSLALPDGSLTITVPTEKVQPLFDQAKCVYLVKMDVGKDIHSNSKTCLGVLEEMEQTGTIISANFNLDTSSQLDADWIPDVPIMLFLFGSILKPDDINVLFEISTDQILQLKEDNGLYHLNGDPVKGDPVARQKDATASTTASTQDSDALPQPMDEPPSQVREQTPSPVEISEPEPTPAEPVVPAAQTETVPLPTAAKVRSNKKQAKVEHETSLRVHVSLLDQLMTLAGELVLSRNQLLQSITSSDHRGSEIAGQRIDLITSELQEAIMLTRMQSIGNVFNKFPRVVRDLAQTLGKEIELTLEGKDVELDKTIIEAIGDPLTHLVRNSVDHGIETPTIRRQAGKNATGQIYLKSYHEAGQVNIEITDDGKGLDGDKLASKAIQKGLINEDQAKLMSQREKTNLIFLPGFSTAGIGFLFQNLLPGCICALTSLFLFLDQNRIPILSRSANNWKISWFRNSGVYKKTGSITRKLPPNSFDFGWTQLQDETVRL